MKDFADVLIEYMKKNNDTQYGINKKTGVSLSTINDIVLKKKSPTQRTIQKICSGLGISLAEFDDDTLEVIPGNHPVSNSDFPSMESVLAAIDGAAVTEDEKRAAAIIKAMSKNEQQASFLKVIEKYKSLSAEHQEALAKLINSLPSQK